jgi:hypothetical protein
MIAIGAGPLVRLILYDLYHLRRWIWPEFWPNMRWSIGTLILLYAGSFVYHWFKHNSLPRTLSPRRQKKITSNLRHYQGTLVVIEVCRGVSDGWEFATSLESALTEAGWNVISAGNDSAPNSSRYHLGRVENIEISGPNSCRDALEALQKELGKWGVKSCFKESFGNGSITIGFQ